MPIHHWNFPDDDEKIAYIIGITWELEVVHKRIPVKEVFRWIDIKLRFFFWTALD